MAHVATRFPDYTDPIENNGSILVSVKSALLKVFRAVTGKNVFIGNETTVSSTANTTVSGLSFIVRAGRQYRIHGTALLTANSTSGVLLGLSLSGSSGGTGQVNYKYTAATTVANQAVTSNPLTSNSTGITGTGIIECDIDGYFVPDVSGTLTVQAALTTGSTAATVGVGSWVSVIRVKG